MSFYDDLIEIRRKKPLVHHITNFVVMNDSANITLALGASPIMAHAIDELEDLIKIASVLYINIGTLDPLWIQSMKMAGKIAEKYNVPVLLDPVGAGASKLRTETVFSLLENFPVSILKGNGGEMLALSGREGGVKGVDSLVNADINVADNLAEKYNLTAVITGKIDIISDGKKKALVENGSELFQYITGSGCMVGSVISSFLGVLRDSFKASVDGLVTFNIAGELAEKKSSGPGSFRQILMDEIYNMNEEKYKSARVKYL